MSPNEIMLPHLVVRDATFTAAHTRFPKLPWLLQVSTVRILGCFAVGAPDALALLDGLIIDAVWAALVPRKLGA